MFFHLLIQISSLLLPLFVFVVVNLDFPLISGPISLDLNNRIYDGVGAETRTSQASFRII